MLPPKPTLKHNCSRSLGDLDNTINNLHITMPYRYQSPVKHLPKHITPAPSSVTTYSPSPVRAHIQKKPSQLFATIIEGENSKLPSKTDTSILKNVPFIPSIQLCLLWSNISIFIVSIILAIIGIIIKSVILTSSILVISGISGLIFSYSYKINLRKILALKTKLFQFIDTQKLDKINAPFTSNSDEQHQASEPEQVSLLSSFRNGDFHQQLAICSSEDLKQLLPVVAQSLCQLPFGLTQFRSSLFVILANRISKDPSLDQAWRFFLNCNRDIPEIIRTWENHEYLKPEQRSEHENDDENDENEYKAEEENESGQNSVALFRSLFKDLNKTGSRKSVPLMDFICDPISGNLLTEVQLRRIMPSNSKPYLIDFYGLDINEISTHATLCSTMLLKQGDDLRKDLGIMLMFKLMNELWTENEANYNGQRCETLVYNVVPMAVDFGAIEFIEGAHKIANIDSVIQHIHSKEQLNVTMDRLIATAAASYVASYVCGVRDRHHDNILICNDGRLFNIDFSHILGEKLSGLDAAKIAIPNKFVKVLGNDHWIKFLEVVVICYDILRKNYVELLDYARIVFGFMKRSEENEKYLKQSLMIDIDDIEALKKIKSLFGRAPSQIKTKMKNAMHRFSVKQISKSCDT